VSPFVPLSSLELEIYYYNQSVVKQTIPLKDHHFGFIPLLSHLHVGPHESMTCGVYGIYLKFGSFNGIDPFVP
jgi:hypothetical protein